ncbi:hypothetical protein D3C86_2008420 [compost metagenome]
MASTVKLPYWPWPLLGSDQLWVSVASTSVTASWPPTVVVPSSVTAPVNAPSIVGLSLLPVMVTVTSWVAVPPWPSLTVTVMVSVTCWPAASACTCALALFST